MKTLSFLLTIAFLMIWSAASNAQSLPDGYDYDYTDTDGNTQNIQDYLDQEKSVFIFFFDNSPWTYQEYEDLNLTDFYNTYGQGGNNDVVVLCMAIYGFDTYSSLSNIDFSEYLGSNYENVSYTENNPIPMIINPIGADSLEYYGLYGLNMLCYDDHQYQFSSGNAELYMNTLYDLCCTSLESYDPGLHISYTPTDCNPLNINYSITNGAPVSFDATDIDVLINGQSAGNFTVNQTVEGCSSVPAEYTNPNFSETDSITLAIANSNLNTSNDTIHTYLQNVDTISGRVRLEVQNPVAPYTDAYLNSTGNSYGSVNINAENNYTGDIFLPSGCQTIHGGLFTEDTTSCTVLISSIDAFGNTEDTLFYESLAEEYPTYFDGAVYVTEAIEPMLSGYVFEDVNATQTFAPELPRIAGVEVSHGPYTTFTDANGFYQIPATTTADSITISYDENVWQVITTANPLHIYSQNPSPYNFGLNQDAPFDSLSMNYNSNIPFYCWLSPQQSLTIHNVGNQATDGQVAFTYDPILTPASYSEQPDEIDGTTLTYNIPELNLNGFYVINVWYDELTSDDIGEILNSEVTLYYNDVNDSQVLADTINSLDSLYCSYDPNDIYGFPRGTGEQGYIPANTQLKYRIRFQNTGNAPATNIVVIDTLPEELNWDSFEPLSASHPYSVQLNENTRAIKWTFANINLPDSSSDLLGSNGNIWYSVAMNPLEQGEQIVNQAAIYFDANAPVLTNTSLHTIQGVTAVAKIEGNQPFSFYPNPARDELILSFEKRLKGRVEIFDLQGRKCMESGLDGSSKNISIRSLDSGMYLITVTNTRNGLSTSERFVKL